MWRNLCTTLSVLAVSFVIAPPVFAQFTSGSSGIHGAFPPAALPSGTNYIVLNVTTGLGRYCSVYDITNRPETCTTELGNFQLTGIPVGGLKTGILEFTNVNLAPGNTAFLEVYFVGNPINNPLTILSQNDIRLGSPSNVTFRLKVDGLPGRNPPNVSFSGAGGDPGPGGAPGGSGGAGGSTPGNGNQGFGPSGGAGGAASAATAAALRGVSAGSSPASFSLTPLRGGSGGGGGAGINPVNSLGCGTAILGYGGAGGGGGGGLTMAATNEIFLGINGNTQIDASGGPGGDSPNTTCRPTGGGGEGGSVRLISKTLSGAGSIVLSGGTAVLGSAAAGGKIRIEANSNTYTGAITGAGGGSFTQFPGAPIPSDLPTLRITSIAGVATPAAPTGSLTVPDVNFATAPTNPASVSLAATKIPVGTTVSVRVTAAIGAAVTVTSSALTGTFDNSTATASVDIPPGQGQIAATVAFTLPPQSAMLMGLPNIDGTKPQHVEVVAGGEGASRVYVVAENGARFEIGGR